ncbi:MAG: nucleotidyltransferase domain-containing protein [Deltaproteobacteria bacterium]|nr:nucleotidyltransferase domain-containing protein [Deltaproteobacteria bacterium]
MKSIYFQISTQTKEEIITHIRSFLEKLPDLVFAYVHGSFITDEKFRDIDVAVYLKAAPLSPLQMELDLETELANVINNYPVDVRILNDAPLSFRYNIIKHGKPLVVFDDDARSDFEESTFSHYFDFAPYRKLYLKEALGRGV